MFRLDIKQELEKHRQKTEAKENKLLNEAKKLLEQGKKLDEDVLNRLKASDESKQVSALKEIDPKNIYSLKTIEKVCIRYRLRFLDTKYFKPEFPYDAVMKIRAIERANEIRIERFKIIAPGEAFNLEDVNKDPLLFAELADGHYYLLHKWGKDLSWIRKIIAWPLQTLSTFFLTLVVICGIVAFTLPNDWVVRSESLYPNLVQFRMMLMVQLIIGLFFFLVFIGLAFHRNFSSMDWKSKNFN